MGYPLAMSLGFPSQPVTWFMLHPVPAPMNEVIPASDLSSSCEIMAVAPGEGRAGEPWHDRCVLVCQHRTCIRHGAAQVMAAFQAVAIPGVTVQASGCLGQCSIGPNVRILPDEIWYARLTPADVEAITEEHLGHGQPVDRLLNPRIHQPFYCP